MRLAQQADQKIKFQIEGPGEILGVANSNLESVEPYQAKEHSVVPGARSWWYALHPLQARSFFRPVLTGSMQYDQVKAIKKTN